MVQSQQRESERRKEARIPWVMQPALVLQGISQKERGREGGRKEGSEAGRKEGRQRDPSSDGAKVF